MFLELILGGISGFLLGIITGLTPGLHINLASAIIVSAAAPFIHLQPFYFSALLVSAMISHNMFDFIPSVFLGAPDEAEAMSVLPAHQLLLLGRGVEAVYYSAVGAVVGALLMIIISIPFWFFLPIAYGLSQGFIGFVLILLPFAMILREQKGKRFFALALILLSACLGFATFSIGLKDPLLPLLSGLFGISVLLGNFSVSAKIPPQLLDLPKIELKGLSIVSSVGSIIGSLPNLFPGVGPSQASILTISATNVKKKELVIASVSAVSTGSVFGSIIALSALGKARNAPLVHLQNLISVSSDLIAALMLLGIIVLAIGSLTVVFLAPFFMRIIAKFDYRTLTAAILALTLSLVLWRTWLIGILILSIGTCLGIAAHKAEVGKHHLMACLLIPTASYFLF